MKQSPKNPKRGRPKIELSDAQVELLASFHLTLNELAKFFGCSKKTLTNRFADNIQRGWNEAKVSLKRKQFEVALGGNTALLIWLGKQYLNQKDRHEVDWSKIPDTELARIIEARLSAREASDADAPVSESKPADTARH